MVVEILIGLITTILLVIVSGFFIIQFIFRFCMYKYCNSLSISMVLRQPITPPPPIPDQLLRKCELARLVICDSRHQGPCLKSADLIFEF
jgi:hypothetical protein